MLEFLFFRSLFARGFVVAAAREEAIMGPFHAWTVCGVVCVCWGPKAKEEEKKEERRKCVTAFADDGGDSGEM